MDAKLFVATKAFIMHKGKVLLIREAAAYTDTVHTGKYDLPGGRITPGETLPDALTREVQEETGLTIRIGRSIFVNESWPKPHGEQWQIVRIFFECFSDSTKITLSEDHDGVLWIDPKDYKQHAVIENLHPVFEAYLHQHHNS